MNLDEEKLMGPCSTADVFRKSPSFEVDFLQTGHLWGLMVLAEEFVREGRKDLAWGPRTEAVYEQIFEELIAHPDGGALLVIPGIGFACAVAAPYDAPHGETAVGWGIYVRQAWRGRGLARKLHEGLLAALRERGFSALVTGSDTPGGAAILAGMEPVSSYGVIRLGGE